MEVKVLNIDVFEIEEKLKKIGAVFLKDEEQTNIRFDTEDKYLKNEYNGYMRIRETKNKITGEVRHTLTLKRNISRDEVRINEEIETDISNQESLIKIFEALGFVRKKPGRKCRKSYVYDNILFEIDQWEADIYPKPYLEIEVKCKEDLERAIALLGINREDISVKSIDELSKDI